MKKLISRKLLLDTPVFKVSDNRVIDPHGQEIHRLIVEHDGSAVVMPVNEKGRVLLVRQYRYPARTSLWELPAGKVDEGESPLRAAKRELKEETGFQARKWKKLIRFYASPGFQQEAMTLFLARDLQAGEAEPGEGEENIEMQWFKLREIEDGIRTGKICDAKTIIGMYYYQHFIK